MSVAPSFLRSHEARQHEFMLVDNSRPYLRNDVSAVILDGACPVDEGPVNLEVPASAVSAGFKMDPDGVAHRALGIGQAEHRLLPSLEVRQVPAPSAAGAQSLGDSSL